MSGAGRTRRGDRHSRTIAWLKVALPLAALGILSTLFLLSRAMEPDAVIPFADKEIQDRLRDQQITGPFFSGTTPDGDELSFSADTLKSPAGSIGKNTAENVRARIVTSGGATFQMSSDQAVLDIAEDLATLEGDVTILTSTGYRVNTQSLETEVSNIVIYAPKTVEAQGPIGTLTAGNMTIQSPDGSTDTQMLFSGGVKLVYTPN